MTDMQNKKFKEGGERIAKFLARAGIASRRDSEKLIEAGHISVNGKVLTTPAFKVTIKDKVTFDGKIVRKDPPRLWKYHKPPGLLTTHKDPGGRPTVFESLPKTLPRVMSVGRLDMNSEGLLLLTNDGELARALELPSTGFVRRYRARAYGKVNQDTLDSLMKGIMIDGIPSGPIEATLERQQRDNAWIQVSIREGKNREVRRALETIGLRVNRLIRISYGPFQLANLDKGANEEVKSRVLRDQLGHLISLPADLPNTGASGNTKSRTGPKTKIGAKRKYGQSNNKSPNNNKAPNKNRGKNFGKPSNRTSPKRPKR